MNPYPKEHQTELSPCWDAPGRTRPLRGDKTMFESWTMISFLAGCALLLIIPAAVTIYRELIRPREDDSHDL